ncbi:hypothetical protein CWI39_2082p0010 [Hamiltosporidium magnivora]|uniref:Endonuclease/exonuclease/phosphatase domain-containing protein n=1 Tax=Hamiltosporidium magnivora TaxID=148818 RepID=A0A4Q9KYG9_9MICR|nr:hypothetical protein CWI39_2082p0010 [Hamiltosporidium magnivora]
MFINTLTTIILLHAPIEEFSKKYKDSFYEQLKKLNSNTPRDDGKLILGDINAKVVLTLKCKRIHTTTWKSPYDISNNQIDHVLIDLRHGSDILDVRTYRGADVDSDNYLVVVDYLKTIYAEKKEREAKSDRKLSVDKLSNNQETREGYQVQLENNSCEVTIRDIERHWGD